MSKRVGFRLGREDAAMIRGGMGAEDLFSAVRELADQIYQLYGRDLPIEVTVTPTTMVVEDANQKGGVPIESSH